MTRLVLIDAEGGVISRLAPYSSSQVQLLSYEDPFHDVQAITSELGPSTLLLRRHQLRRAAHPQHGLGAPVLRGRGAVRVHAP